MQWSQFIYQAQHTHHANSSCVTAVTGYAQATPYCIYAYDRAGTVSHSPVSLPWYAGASSALLMQAGTLAIPADWSQFEVKDSCEVWTNPSVFSANAASELPIVVRSVKALDLRIRLKPDRRRASRPSFQPTVRSPQIGFTPAKSCKGICP